MSVQPQMTLFLSYPVRTLMAAVYPRRCCGCGRSLAVQPGSSIVPDMAEEGEGDWLPIASLFGKGMSLVLCNACAADFTPIESPLCPICGARFQSREGIDHTCGRCQEKPWQFHSARAAGLYQGALMAAVHKLKYRHRTSLAKPLGEFLLQACKHWFVPSDFDLVLPVPLHRQKLRQRGFNQSYLLIREWLRPPEKCGEIFSAQKIRHDVLLRTRKTLSQTKLSRKERLENVKDAFAVADPEKIAGKRVLVVDDVYTTGATVNECAKVLMTGGAAQVDILTLARVN